MRIWDLNPCRPCRNHLLGEHRELHAVWSILTRHKKGYSRHPETLRWKGKLRALFLRHKALVKEMDKRHYAHRSPLSPRLATERNKQDVLLASSHQQIHILRLKKCNYDV